MSPREILMSPNKNCRFLQSAVFNYKGYNFGYIKAGVGNVVQKHFLLYWGKWSYHPKSTQYIMCSEKETTIKRALWQLQACNNSDQSLPFGPNGSDWSKWKEPIRCLHVSSCPRPPPPLSLLPACTRKCSAR